MTLSQIRNRVRTLQRKYGLALAVIRLRPYADQFCHQWQIANANCQPLPQSHPFILRLANAGFRCATFIALDKYIQGPYPLPYPTPRGIITALFPRAASTGIMDDLLYCDRDPNDAPPDDPDLWLAGSDLSLSAV